MVKNKINAKKSFFENIILTLGVVIGVGIFFKNKSIFAFAHGDSTIILIGWVLGAIISLSSAIAFSLLSFKAKHSDNNIAEFSRMSYGLKFANVIKWANVLVYYPIYTFVIALFSSIQFLNLVGFSQGYSYYVIVLFTLTVSIILLFMLISFRSEKLLKKVNATSTFIKALPFVILLIIAISAIMASNDHAYWNNNPHQDPKLLDPSAYNQVDTMSDISIVFVIIPPIKFAFDGFITITANKRASTPKSLAWGISLGMILVSGLFIATTIALLKEGTPYVPDAIVYFLGGDANNMSTGYLIINKLVITIIAISGFGSMSGFIVTWKRSAIQIVDDNKGIKAKTHRMILLFGLLFSCLPWLILTFIIKYGNSGTLGADGTDVFDTVSNVVLLSSFSLNALVLVKFIYYKFRKKTDLSWVFVFFSIIAVIGIGMTGGYKIVNHLIIELIHHGNEVGIFGWPKWTYAIVFILVVLQFVFATFVKNILIKKTAKSK